jgi:superfamily I DNA/RNA helicase
VSLNTNCRQSPKLSEAIVQVLGLQPEIKRHRIDPDADGTLEVLATTPERQMKDLAKVINRLLEDYRPQDIRILSVYGGNGSVMAKLFEEKDLHSKELRELRKLLKHPVTKEGKISWRSIGKYKGLEDDVVVLTDLSLNAKEWLGKQGKTLSTQIYVGLTRARTHAVMLVQDDLYSANITMQIQ